jgi:hypothetical protein
MAVQRHHPAGTYRELTHSLRGSATVHPGGEPEQRGVVGVA